LEPSVRAVLRAMGSALSRCCGCLCRQEQGHPHPAAAWALVVRHAHGSDNSDNHINDIEVGHISEIDHAPSAYGIAQQGPQPQAAPPAPPAPSEKGMQKVSTADYKKWEREVIDTFYTTEQKMTALFPEYGCPSVVKKEKVIAVVLAGSGWMVSKVADSETIELPERTDISLFHIGKQKVDGVGYGYSGTKKEFVHPGVDVGGLTNYRQPHGKPADFVPDVKVVVSPECDSVVVGNQLYDTWNRLAPKALPEELKQSLAEVVKTIKAVHGEQGAELRFWQPPPEHRVLVTSQEVKERTGRYYVRLFGKDASKGAHAIESDGADLFAGVSKTSITPNINANNIGMEYQTYGAGRAARPDQA